MQVQRKGKVYPSRRDIIGTQDLTLLILIVFLGCLHGVHEDRDAKNMDSQQLRKDWFSAFCFVQVGEVNDASELVLVVVCGAE